MPRASVGPAWGACRSTPLEAIRPGVRPPRKAARITSIGRLALAGVARWPSRTIFAAASLFVGVGAVVIAVIGAVAGAVTGVVSISIFLPVGVANAAGAALVAVGLGVLTAVIAVSVPLSRLSAIAPATAISAD